MLAGTLLNLKPRAQQPQGPRLRAKIHEQQILLACFNVCLNVEHSLFLPPIGDDLSEDDIIALFLAIGALDADS